MRKGTGLFGGTFDPVHDGHVLLAREIFRRSDLEHIVILPASSPPHKPNQLITPFEHRVQMLRLAFADTPFCQISRIEQQLASPCYTIDTLLALKKNKCAAEPLSFLLGGDAFLEIHLWKSYRKVLEQVDIIVSSRGVVDRKTFEIYTRNLGYEPCGDAWLHGATGRKITFLETSAPDVSSSEIRLKLRSGETVEDGVHPDVIDYIRKNSLYCSSSC